MSATTRTQISKENTEFYDMNLLFRAVARFVHNRWAQIRDIPRKGGTNQIKFRRYSNLAAATTALTEGITPTGSQLAKTDITADVDQFGDFVLITDVLDFESKDPVLVEAGEILGDQAGDTLDQLTRDIIVAGTNVRFSGTATSRVTVATTDLITADDVKKVRRTLVNNKTMKINTMVTPNTGISTTPLDASFIGIVHPNVAFTLNGLTGFIKVEQYPSQRTVMDGEIGYLNEVRFIETTNAKVFSGAGAAGIDVYATLIFGMHAYGTTRISGEAMRNIIKGMGTAGSADPLDQRQSSGWKATFVAKILNNDFLVRVESAAAA